MSTTETRTAESKDIISTLNRCIEICIDGEKGYAAAATDAHAPALKVLFQQGSQERADFVLALQTAIQKLGAVPEHEGTAKGTAHRGWMEVRRLIEGHSDRTIVEEWARGEHAALEGYQAALKRAPLVTLPLEFRTLLQNQYAAVRAAADEARRQLTATH